VQLLCHESELEPSSSLPSFQWFELEKYYVAKLTALVTLEYKVKYLGLNTYIDIIFHDPYTL